MQNNQQSLWVITSEEKSKLEKQFLSLNPTNGFITGNQAKSLFTKSNLSIEILGKIWALSDYDKDGQMTITEFCIAMHLIKRKLEGYDIPDVLPPQLATLFYSSIANFYGYMPVSNAYNTMPAMQNNNIPLSMNNNTMGMSSSITYPSSNMITPMMPVITTSISHDIMSQNVTKSSIPEDEWSMSQAVKPRYRLQFNQQDRNKRGFLTGVEAKAILVQSGLPQNSLAQIWSLADIDKDGNLTCEEFCIAMHLVEQARAGKTLPNQLPSSLLPSLFQRKAFLSSSLSASIGGNYQSLSNGVQSKQNPPEKEEKSVITGEDERRANYLKGQAELEKRRAILEEQMQIEEENRRAKEKAEFEKLERIRIEKEQARIAEMKRQMEVRRHQELEREEQIQRVADEREKCRLDNEKHRLMELEKRRLEVAIGERRQEQEQLSEVNCKKGNLVDALANEMEKKRDLQNRIDSTKDTLDGYKAGIGSMREHRDKLIGSTDYLMEELQAAKSELNRCQREKQNLELQLQSTLQSDPVLEQIKTVQALKTSHKDKIKQLDKEIKDLEQKMTKRGQKLASNRNKVRDIEKKVTTKLISDIKKLQTSVCEKKNAAFAILKRQKDSRSSSVDDGHSDDSSDKFSAFRKPLSSVSKSLPFQDSRDLLYFTALYPFDGRQDDELTFLVGDTIVIDRKEQMEPSSGWLYGCLYGTDNPGMFPETFVTPLNDEISMTQVNTQMSASLPKQNHSQPSNDDFFDNLLLSQNITPKKDSGELWVKAVYGWRPEASSLYGEYPNQLSFETDQLIKVIDMKPEDWWTGEMTIIDKFGKETKQVGWFPRSYVTLITEDHAHQPDSGTVTPTAGSMEDIASKYSSLNLSMKLDQRRDENANKVFAVALYPYQSSILGDLNIQPGDIIETLEQKLDWWKGHNRSTNQQGLFPSNYVRLLNQEEIPRVDDANFCPVLATTSQSADVSDNNSLMFSSHHSNCSVNSLSSSTYSSLPDMDSSTIGSHSSVTFVTNGGSSTPEIVEVMIEFVASGAEQLSLQIGQMLQVREKSQSGWWKGEIQQRGQQRRIGWFPGHYVKSINPSQSIISDPSYNDNCCTPPSCTTPTPMNSWSNNDYTSQVTVVELNDSMPGDHIITMYSYAAQNVDELSFEKNTILMLIDKNEPEWWMGRNLLTQQEGLFPVNYVRRLDPDSATDQESIAAVEQADSQSSSMVSGRPVSWYIDGTMTFNAILTEDEKRRQFYIRELIETEKVYYEDLQEVHQIFVEPIKKSNLLTADEIKAIFLNWTDLIPNSYNFYMALKIRKDRAGNKQPIQSIGDILLSNFPNFIVYVRFCSMQNQAIAKLQKRQQQNPLFKELCERCETNLRCQKMPMTSYFLKPMQRITKYKLLVENILKHTEDNHPDRSDMEEAVAAARSLCESVNEGVRERENSERLEWLQEHLQCETLSEKLYFNSNTNCLGHRKILYSGTLYKAKSSKKELVGFLFNDFLLLGIPCYNTGGTPFVFPLETSSKDKMQFKMYKKPIILNQVLISSGAPTTGSSSSASQSSHNDIFTVKEANFEHILRALSTNDRDKWVERIMNASMFYINTENSKRERSMSMRRTAGVGRLVLTIVEGINLHSSRKEGKSDPFCEASLGNQLHRTKVISSTANPKWNTPMQFLIKNIEQDVLCLTVYNKDYFAPNEFLGRIEVSVNSVMNEKRTCRESLEKKLKLMEIDSGELIVKLDMALFKKN